MKIIYTRKAKQDLARVRDHYEPLSQISLQNIVDDIVTVIEDLPHSISRGRNTPHEGVWEKISPKYSYLIPYHIYEGKLFILRVFHTSRDTLDYAEIVDLEE